MQKRAYRLLAYICARRSDFTRAHLTEVLEALLAGVTTSLSAAKRYRLKCLQVRPCHPGAEGFTSYAHRRSKSDMRAALQAAVLLLLAPDAPAVSLGASKAADADGDAPMDEDEQRKQARLE